MVKCSYPSKPLIFFSVLLGLLLLPRDAMAQNQDEIENPAALPNPTSLTTPLTAQEKADSESLYVAPEEKVRATYGSPPNARPISDKKLWVDLKKKRVYVDGYVTMREGPLEMFACPIGTKEHEAIIATLAQSSEVHAALLAVGSRSGTPVQFLPEFVPATGQRIRVWICYHDEDKKFQVADAKHWVKNSRTKKTLQTDWVFSGSGFWKDPNDGREYYRADGGDMICVSNFSTAMMDLPIASSAEANALQFSPNTAVIPQRGTPIRMVLYPIPINTPVASNEEADPVPAGKPQPSTIPSAQESLNERPKPTPVSTPKPTTEPKKELPPQSKDRVPGAEIDQHQSGLIAPTEAVLPPAKS